LDESKTFGVGQRLAEDHVCVVDRLRSEPRTVAATVSEQVDVELLDLERRERLELVTTEVALQPLACHHVRLKARRTQASFLAGQPLVQVFVQPIPVVTTTVPSITVFWTPASAFSASRFVRKPCFTD